MYENITIEECRSAVKELTEMESRNMQDFDSILVKECAPMLKQFCQVQFDRGSLFWGGKVEPVEVRNRFVKCAMVM